MTQCGLRIMMTIIVPIFASDRILYSYPHTYFQILAMTIALRSSRNVKKSDLVASDRRRHAMQMLKKK